MDTISKIKEKINILFEKPEIRSIAHVFLVILLMTSSFLLGKLSERTSVPISQKPLEIYLPNGELLTQTTTQAAQSQLSAYILGGAEAAVVPENGPEIAERLNAIPETEASRDESQIFGSKNGSTYYTPGCKSGDRVKPENRVYFESESAAEDEGYSRSKLCK